MSNNDHLSPELLARALDDAANEGHTVRRYHDRADIVNANETAILSIRWSDVKDPRKLGYPRGSWTPGRVRVHTIKLYETTHDATERIVHDFDTIAAALEELAATC